MSAPTQRSNAAAAHHRSRFPRTGCRRLQSRASSAVTHSAWSRPRRFPALRRPVDQSSRGPLRWARWTGSSMRVPGTSNYVRNLGTPCCSTSIAMGEHLLGSISSIIMKSLFVIAASMSFDTSRANRGVSAQIGLSATGKIVLIRWSSNDRSGRNEKHRSVNDGGVAGHPQHGAQVARPDSISLQPDSRHPA